MSTDAIEIVRTRQIAEAATRQAQEAVERPMRRQQEEQRLASLNEEAAALCKRITDKLVRVPAAVAAKHYAGGKLCEIYTGTVTERRGLVCRKWDTFVERVYWETWPGIMVTSEGELARQSAIMDEPIRFIQPSSLDTLENLENLEALLDELLEPAE